MCRDGQQLLGGLQVVGRRGAREGRRALSLKLQIDRAGTRKMRVRAGGLHAGRTGFRYGLKLTGTRQYSGGRGIGWYRYCVSGTRNRQRNVP